METVKKLTVQYLIVFFFWAIIVIKFSILINVVYFYFTHINNFFFTFRNKKQGSDDAIPPTRILLYVLISFWKNAQMKIRWFSFNFRRIYTILCRKNVVFNKCTVYKPMCDIFLKSVFYGDSINEIIYRVSHLKYLSLTSSLTCYIAFYIKFEKLKLKIHLFWEFL